MSKDFDQKRAEFKEKLEKNRIQVGSNTIIVPQGVFLGIGLLGKIDFFLNHCGFRLVKM